MVGKNFLLTQIWDVPPTYLGSKKLQKQPHKLPKLLEISLWEVFTHRMCHPVNLSFLYLCT